jgi:hypothetical protein
MLYLLSLWGSAIPAALLVVGLFDRFRAKLPSHDAMLLAAGFAFGSFVLPYSGMLMVHVAVAAMLFFAWRLVDEGHSSLLAGGLIGLAITFDISVSPLVAVYAWLAATTRGRRDGIEFLIGPCVGVGAILIYQRVFFGGFLATPHGFEKEVFVHKHLFLGHFDWPDPRRLYWLTLHPLRGVLYLCPIFVLPLLSLLAPRLPDRRAILPLLVVAYFLLFNLTFDGWTGGWGAGPRYLIPATPFLFVFVAPALTRFRVLVIALIAVSMLNMLAITAVRAQFPAATFGPPSTDNPAVECLVCVRKNQLAHDPGSFNWGLRMGMKGKWSLIPPLLVIGSMGFAGLRRGRGAVKPGDSSKPG